MQKANDIAAYSLFESKIILEELKIQKDFEVNQKLKP